jgi:hypothetical protein
VEKPDELLSLEIKARPAYVVGGGYDIRPRVGRRPHLIVPKVVAWYTRAFGLCGLLHTEVRPQLTRKGQLRFELICPTWDREHPR